MCFNDWRAGTLIRSVPHFLGAYAGVNSVIPANPNRVAIAISAYDTTGANPGSPIVIDRASNCPFASGVLPGATVYINLLTHADQVQKELLVIWYGAAVTGFIGYTEWVVPSDYLQIGLDSFVTEYSRKL